GERRAVLQSALRGGLDDRAVGDRIGEGDAELDRVRAGLGEREDDIGGGAVAAGDVGDQAEALLGTKALEESLNAVQALPPAARPYPRARSDSPRPPSPLRGRCAAASRARATTPRSEERR